MEWQIVFSPVFTAIVSNLKAHGSKDDAFLSLTKGCRKHHPTALQLANNTPGIFYLQKAR